MMLHATFGFLSSTTINPREPKGENLSAGFLGSVLQVIYINSINA
jgi:hypothetical protein